MCPYTLGTHAYILRVSHPRGTLRETATLAGTDRMDLCYDKQAHKTRGLLACIIYTHGRDPE